MPILVDTVTLLKLIHDSFELSKERKDEAIFNAAQSLLSVLVYHLRHPMATIDAKHGQTIHELEALVNAHRGSQKGKRGTSSFG